MRRGAEGGAVGMHGPPCGAREGGEDVVHVGAGGEREVAVLPQPGQHAAGDGPAVPLPQLRPLLLLSSPSPPLRRRAPRRGRRGGGGGVGRDGGWGGVETRPAGGGAAAGPRPAPESAGASGSSRAAAAVAVAPICGRGGGEKSGESED